MNDVRTYDIIPLGNEALLVSFGNEIQDTLHQKVIKLYRHIKALQLPCVKDVVPAYSSLAVYYDIAIIYKMKKVIAAFQFMASLIKEMIDQEKEEGTVAQTNKLIEIPICYAPSKALDITFIAAEKHLSVEEVVQIHTSMVYTVYMIGFLPGFPYMGKVDSRIFMPRKTQPRQRIEAGSVGIAGEQTGIYPLASPGGWQIIGRTPLSLFQKNSEKMALLTPGDQVQFYSITEYEFDNY